ncbi:MAG: arginine--tRNA ligase [Ignavibacteriae bacterium HGW-Ignavibacteriae-2]|nr:arginine--tRNA ligase [Bacteroidota bacterium]PKL89628.1 MAG: arginine--tRNA ligase [Ignavibacteriae bacterium HGW-Ignavibacteriae-2]
MKNYLTNLFAASAEKLIYLKDVDISFSVPKSESHGDLSTNVAMLLTKQLKKNPRQIAEEIIKSLELDTNVITNVEIAGPGFINFHFSSEYVSQIIDNILTENEKFGKSDKYKGKTANVEFVSANPTGPLTIGHGRNAVLGDALATLLEYVGYDVEREYYFNNAGRQMRVLGDSVKLRYLEMLGETIEFPDDYYQGEYIKDIASSVIEEYGEKVKSEDAEGVFKQAAEQAIFTDIKNTLSRLGIIMKNFFNEHTLYTDKKIDGVLAAFKEKGLSYENEDAVWLKLTDMGNEQDKVIVKSTGEPTYRLPDIAYHINKFERNYDLIVDLFGSDHAATYPDVMAGCRALGYDTDKVKVMIHQFVTIMENGEIVKMSTRKANFVTIDELIDEVGADVVRYFFVMRNMNTHLNFELDLAKKQSDENPVFYLQYAHARIASILRMTEQENLKSSTEFLNLLIHPSEQRLIKKLHQFAEEILYAAENFEPNKVANYLEELAAIFHKFYTDCRILGSDKTLAEARIALAKAAQIVLRNGLTLLKVSTPERM